MVKSWYQHGKKYIMWAAVSCEFDMPSIVYYQCLYIMLLLYCNVLTFLSLTYGMLY